MSTTKMQDFMSTIVRTEGDQLGKRTGASPEPAAKPRRSHTPRLQGLQHESVHVRLPKEQVVALSEIAADEFRSLPDQLAYIVDGWLREREAEP